MGDDDRPDRSDRSDRRDRLDHPDATDPRPDSRPEFPRSSRVIWGKRVERDVAERALGVELEERGAVRQDGGALHPPMHADEARQRGEDLVGRQARTDRKRRGEQRVVGLEAAGQGQVQVVARAEGFDLERLAVR